MHLALASTTQPLAHLTPQPNAKSRANSHPAAQRGLLSAWRSHIRRRRSTEWNVQPRAAVAPPSHRTTQTVNHEQRRSFFNTAHPLYSLPSYTPSHHVYPPSQVPLCQRCPLDFAAGCVGTAVRPQARGPFLLTFVSYGFPLIFSIAGRAMAASASCGAATS
jgi:hypothetical protein